MTMALIFPNQEAAPRTSNLVNSGKLTCNWKIIEKELIEKPGAVVTKLGTAQQRARTQSPSHPPTRRTFPSAAEFIAKRESSCPLFSTVPERSFLPHKKGAWGLSEKMGTLSKSPMLVDTAFSSVPQRSVGSVNGND